MRGTKPATLVVVANNEPRMGKAGELATLPSYIDISMSDIWDVAIKSLADRKLLAADILPMLETYVMALRIQHKSMEAIERDGLTYVEKKTGDIKKHPATAELKAAREDAIRVATELGLTPVSRSRRGMNGSAEGSPAPVSDQESDDGTPPGLAI